MNDKVKQLADWIISGARSNLEEDKHLMPCAFIVSETQIGCVTCRWDDDRKKEATLAVIRSIAKEKNAWCVAIVTEIWYSVMAVPKEDEPSLDKLIEHWDGIKPSQKPDRQEGVMLYIETLDGYWYGIAPIIRTGDKVTFGEMEFKPLGERHPSERLQKFLVQLDAFSEFV